jgi:hypothetical protein
MYEELLKFAYFSRLSYFDYKITPEELMVIDADTRHNKLIFIDCKDTQVWIFVDEDKEEMVIAFRGSDSLGDLLTNLCIIPSKFMKVGGWVHSGYLASYQAVRNQLFYYITKHIRKGGKKLSICGHSLGGVCASLCALEMSILTNLDVRCYSFGAPPGGDPQFCSQLAIHVPQYYRIVHNQDFAPTLPMFFYKHCDETIHRCVQLDTCVRVTMQPPVMLQDIDVRNSKYSAHACTQSYGNMIYQETRRFKNMRSVAFDYIRYHSIESYIAGLKKKIYNRPTETPKLKPPRTTIQNHSKTLIKSVLVRLL